MRVSKRMQFITLQCIHVTFKNPKIYIFSTNCVCANTGDLILVGDKASERGALGALLDLEADLVAQGGQIGGRLLADRAYLERRYERVDVLDARRARRPELRPEVVVVVVYGLVLVRGELNDRFAEVQLGARRSHSTYK